METLGGGTGRQAKAAAGDEASLTKLLEAAARRDQLDPTNPLFAAFDDRWSQLVAGKPLELKHIKENLAQPPLYLGPGLADLRKELRAFYAGVCEFDAWVSDAKGRAAVVAVAARGTKLLAHLMIEQPAKPSKVS